MVGGRGGGSDVGWNRDEFGSCLGAEGLCLPDAAHFQRMLLIL